MTRPTVIGVIHTVSEDSLVSMLRQQLDFQRRLGHDFTKMTTDERVQWIKDMTLATVCELTEALNETSWKPWANRSSTVDTIPFVGELSDAWQFITNMWFAALPDLTPEQLAAVMRSTLEAKLVVNRKRHADGYDGVSTKCPRCRRALDDRSTFTASDYCTLPVSQVSGDELVGFCIDEGQYSVMPA